MKKSPKVAKVIVLDQDYLFSISEITIILFYFTTTVGKLVSDIQWRQSRLKTTSAKWDFEALRLEI